MAAAGAAGGGLDVDEVFSTFLHTGTGSAQTIANGIDLTEGGLVWIKDRDSGSRAHYLFDSENLAAPNYNQYLSSNDTDAIYSASGTGNGLGGAFTSNGFPVQGNHSSSGQDYVSWTFRKAPKFFDVVTYSGDGNSTKTISHSLGCQAGMIWVKRLDSSNNWCVWHRDQYSYGGNSYEGRLESNIEFGYNTFDGASSTTFTVKNDTGVNASGGSYVAYVFAHNNNDGGFGPTSDQDIIKCGRYTGNGSNNGPEIDLGFEPQFLLVKRTDGTGNWITVDSMRNFGSGVNSAYLYVNGNNSEFNDYELFRNQSQGFQPRQNFSVINGNNANYIYMAIRRGPMATPENATDVFKVDKTASSSNPAYTSGFPVDMGLERRTVNGGNWSISSRLTHGRFLSSQSNDQESVDPEMDFDYMTGWQEQGYALNDQVAWMWKRAPGYFDVVCYTGGGDATSTHTKKHNLGVAPEMLWVKCRSNNGTNWMVWHKDMNYSTGESYTNKAFMNLNNSNAATLSSNYWSYSGNPQMTDSVFSVGSTYDEVNATNRTYIAYLFASVSGVSKVGAYSGNGGTSANGNGQDIDCGFSNGARFVLIKPSNAGDHWFLFDSERGIVAGNDATLLLNDNAGESSSSDEIDPLNSGFRVLNQNNQLNRTGRNYIFYAIA